jgi:multidrug efflux pump subunit AcrA (membrane-fusion protein)
VVASYEQVKRQLENLMRVREGFVVKAPKSGMLIYKRDWDGKKMGVGAQVSAWDNTVATLPDLTKMITKTYVNEIDISKIKAGQAVDISIDAFPDKKLTGKVTEVANIGEQIQGSNAKVFEVKIIVNEYDTILRPAMTTKCTIITSVVENVMYIPLESVHTQDSTSYVFIDGRRQEVRLGESNENEIILKEGVNENEKIYLSKPADGESWTLDKLPPAPKTEANKPTSPKK